MSVLSPRRSLPLIWLVVVIVVTVIALALASTAHALVSFAPQAPYPVGTHPAQVVVGDFNGDGRPDVAVANNDADSVSVLLGTTGGALAPQTAYPVGRSPHSLTVGDFNGDGDPDLAAANFTSGTVSVLLGEPGGSFGPQATYPANPDPHGISVGDFDGDGNTDIVVANVNSASVSVLLGKGDGTFGPPEAHPAGPTPFATVAVDDFDGNGDPDLAVANKDANTVSVLLGGPGATFGAPTAYSVGSTPHSVAAGDLNGDGDPDLISANFGANTVSVLLGGPGGGFSAQTAYPAGNGPPRVAVGDFDRDGKPDLAVADWLADAVSVLPGDQGVLGPPIAFGVADGPRWVAVGDFNRDGTPDIVAADEFSNAVSVLLNTSNGVVFDPSTVAFESTTVGDTSAARTVTLTNHGQAGVAVSGVALTGADASSFVTSDDSCSGTTVPSGGSCSVKVRFAPTAAGGRTASLRFTDSAPGSPQSVALSGTGISPAALSPASIAFKDRPDHTDSARHAVTLTNVASADLTVGGVAVRGTDASSFPSSGDTCSGHSLSTGQSCTVLVRFRPLGAGAKTAALRFSDSAIDSPQTVALSGTGTPGPWLERSVQALKFGHVHVGTTTATKTVTLSNIGSAPLTITDIAQEGTNPSDFPGLTQTCLGLTRLESGQSCTAGVAFAPTALGTRTATLTVTDTAPRQPHHIALNGTGT
jgi:FG-GAP-like repeat/Abnormal spindle-like microcephaly-assoc'd, ASPM-SPD-2-Hydin/Cep192 domain 4